MKSEVLLTAPPSSAVTVCGHAAVAVQTFSVHEPSGPIENVVLDVTFPSESPAASNPSTVNTRDAPAAIVESEGLIAMWSTVRASNDAVPVAPPTEALTVCVPGAETVHVDLE